MVAEEDATTIVHRSGSADQWWTFAGMLGNAELASRLRANDFDSVSIRLPAGADPSSLATGTPRPASNDPAKRLAAALKFA